MKSQEKMGKGIKRVNQAVVAEEEIEVLDVQTVHSTAQPDPIGLDSGQNGGRPPEPSRSTQDKDISSCLNSTARSDHQGGYCSLWRP